ncbi:cytochrome oxidase c subunit VIb-domain-containing protein [Leucosporidium creatinivorum]|uniref:Cytochrome oxidase c subunit VIb-domain-containing protein n=1 Tax=Leucosporidium creatinivorum TaxID=106004 RepID=A0A1Y2CQJ6_9BASI|nr:cytochrome oxidase c subunit VIb-domain-containing protein [Leucosporidium creatinivorum]
MASWLWSSSKTAEAPSGIPDRSARQQCWDARDRYFGCLDKNSIVVPGQEEGKTCKAEDTDYRKLCAASWVEYFNKRRVLQLRQDLMEAKAAEQRASGGPITGVKA